MPQANSRFSRPRAISPSGVRRDLAVLGGEERGELVAVCLDEVPDAEHDVGPLRERGRAPGREGRLGGRDRRLDLLDRGEVDDLGDLARSPGRRPGPRGPDVRATNRPSIQWLDPCGHGRVRVDRSGFCDLRHGGPRVWRRAGGEEGVSGCQGCRVLRRTHPTPSSLPVERLRSGGASSGRARMWTLHRPVRATRAARRSRTHRDLSRRPRARPTRNGASARS